jgi:dihydrofolate reductase
MSRIAMVIARADNGVIGRHGKLPWWLAEDMRHFKAVTMGKPCIMGRKTWDSLPAKPLSGRANIVVTRDADFLASGAQIAPNVDEALKLAMALDSEEIAVIGGAEIYRAAVPVEDRIYLTEVHADFEGDTHLAPFERREWRESGRDARIAPDGLRYDFVVLERIGRSS